jgi:hypothetical protein
LLHRLAVGFTAVLFLAGMVFAEGPALPDTSGPAFSGIVSQHAKALQIASEARRQALSLLLQQRLDEAAQWLKERKKTRNVTGIAVATTAWDIFESARTNLEASGSFELPPKVRRELEPTVAEFKAARQKVEADFSNTKARIRKEHLDRFTSALCAVDPNLSGPEHEAAIAERFDAMAGSAGRPPSAGTAGTNAASAKGGVVAGVTNVQTAGAVAELPSIMGSSGNAEQWVTVGQWSGTMFGVDVISIPLMDMRQGTNTQTHFNPISGQNSTWVYSAAQALKPTPGLVFRLKRVADRGGVESLEWPSGGNEQALVVRIPPPGKMDSLPAFELQAGLPGGNVSTAFAGPEDLSKVVPGAADPSVPGSTNEAAIVGGGEGPASGGTAGTNTEPVVVDPSWAIVSPVKVAGAADESSPIMGSSGAAEQWVTVGQWSGTLSGEDVVNIPLMDMKPGTNTRDYFSPISGRNSRWIYVAGLSLKPATGLVFRLKRVVDRDGVEAVEWPSERNGYAMDVRTPPHGSAGRLPAFELQVGLTGGDVGAMFAGTVVEPTDSSKPRPLVSLTLQTVPPGAAVWLDGAPMREVWTPCRVRVPVGAHAFRLTLPGYLPLTVSNQNFTADKVLKWSFQPDSRVSRKTLTVSAGASGWVEGGVRVAKGDTLVIEVEGSWSCASGKESVDAGGYPNNDKYFRYYMGNASPVRQFSGANYGALLMKIGEKNRPIAVGRSLRLSVSDSGPLFFDINETISGKLRQDNAGALVLRLTLMPGDATGSPK